MSDVKINKSFLYIRWVLLRLSMVVFDILAVNVSYFLALLVRFYVNFEFNSWAVKYVPAFFAFAPYYTACSLVIFGIMGLYKSLWKYAGLNDMNRIISSSVITCGIHIVGTLLFVMRMPITYYVLGAAFQFVLITLSRFSYRILLVERDRFLKRRKHDALSVLVVGLGESTRTLTKYMDRNPDSMMNIVCIIDVGNAVFEGILEGVPVLSGAGNIARAIRKYEVDRVLVADTIVSPKVRADVKKICHQLDIPMQDFSGFFQSTPSRIPLRSLMEYVDGPVMIEVENEKTCYASAEQVLARISEKYIISSIYTTDGNLCIRLIQDILRPNDTQAEWVQTYQKETGEDISFF